MLVYEKNNHLYGTMNNVPSDSDVQLTYKDADGDTFTPTLNDSYVDDGKGGIIRVSDGKFVSVYIGDSNIIPGGNYQPAEKVLSKITVSGFKTTYAVGDKIDLTGTTVKAYYESGDVEVTTAYTTTPDANTNLTSSDTEVTFSLTVGSVTKTTKKTITVS